ncbi:hypothetical protein HPB50_016899 [Hyalomma asiaticum]|uniref:Uncharacterized protein n=1 Tax=Hyalomma asiaticum TaxID=266040 RepID=A0ACB7SG04_HYAAI|nr:hypothetical protein HPB50_016899 [Hyalomma asiaticum]
MRPLVLLPALALLMLLPSGNAQGGAQSGPRPEGDGQFVRLARKREMRPLLLLPALALLTLLASARPESSEETRASLSPRFPPCATEPSDESYVGPSGNAQKLPPKTTPITGIPDSVPGKGWNDEENGLQVPKDLNPESEDIKRADHWQPDSGDSKQPEVGQTRKEGGRAENDLFSFFKSLVPTN